MYRLLIPHVKPSVREIMIKSHWAPGLLAVPAVYVSTLVPGSRFNLSDFIFCANLCSKFRFDFLTSFVAACSAAL